MPHLIAAWRRHSMKYLITLVLAVPALATFFLRADASAENRLLADFPAVPRGWDEALGYPARIDLWINDHLGLRNQLIGANNWLRYRLFHQFPTIQVIAGQHGRIFLSTHQTTKQPYAAIRIPCGDDHEPFDLTAQLNLFGRTMRANGIEAQLMIVPSAPVMYREDLPGWLARRCQAHPIPMQEALASERVQGKENILYPLAALTAAKPHAAIFPATFFHWGGDGPRLGAETSMRDLWHTDPHSAPPLHTVVQEQPSDIGSLFPGVELSSMVSVIDFAASGVQDCHGPACFPAELSAVMDKVHGAHRFRNPAAPLPRLVMLTDSFGFAAAPWYARYFKDVIQIATNDLARLGGDDTARLKRFLFEPGSPQRILFLYHDNTVQAGRIGIDFRILFPRG